MVREAGAISLSVNSPRDPGQVLEAVVLQLPHLVNGCDSRARLLAHTETQWLGHMVRALRVSAHQPSRANQMQVR